VAEEGLEGLAFRPRPGGPRRYGHDKRIEVFKTACSPPPEGERTWTVRALAERVGIGKSQTDQILAEADLKPHQVRSWLTSLDPDFDTKQADVCGLYLNPPENAIVVSIDEKTSIQAKQPIPSEHPLEPRKPARREFEHKRHGVQALLAALLVHSGKIVGNVYERNSRAELLDFLDRLEQQIPADKHVHANPRQPPGAQNPRGHRLARQPPALAVPLHPHPRLLAQPDRALALDPPPAAASPRNVHQPTRPEKAASRVHRSLQPNHETIRLDPPRKTPHQMNAIRRTLH
jgi:hypothetical protein